MDFHLIDARLMAMDDDELDALRERFQRLLAVAEITEDADTRAIAREAIAGLRQFRAFVRPRARAAMALGDPPGVPGAQNGPARTGRPSASSDSASG